MFPCVVTSASLGLNCAPWNVFERKVERSNGQVVIEGEPILLFHFQGLKIIRAWAFDLYGARPRLPKAVREYIYLPYVSALALQIREMAKTFELPSVGIDADFDGFRGLIRAAKRLRRSPNLIVKW